MTEVFLQDNFNELGSLLLEEDISSDGAYYSAIDGVGHLYVGTESGNAGILRHPSVLPSTYRITIHNYPLEATGYLACIVGGSLPEITDKSTFDATRRIWIWSAGWQVLHICVLGTDGNVYTWDGDSWETGTIPATTEGFDQEDDYRLVLERTVDQKAVVTLYDDEDEIITQTDPVGVYGFSTHEDHYFCCGSPYTDEPFSDGYGFDGEQVEPYFYLDGDDDTITIDDKVTFDCGGAEKNVNLYFDKGLQVSGDFDIQLDFNQTTLDTGAGANRFLTLYMMLDADNYIRALKFRTQTGERFYFQVYVDGGQVYSANPATALKDSKLRITRVGDVVTGYYWDGSWQQIGTYTGFLESNLYTAVQFISNAAANVWEVDNLKVNSGTIRLENRSRKYTTVWGREVEWGTPEMEIINRILDDSEYSPTVNWGGDSLEIINSIREEFGADLDMLINSIGEDYEDSEDLLIINSIGYEDPGVDTHEVVLYMDGEDITDKVTNIEWQMDEARVPNTIRVDIADEYLYVIKRMYTRADADFMEPRLSLYVDGYLIDDYFIDKLEMSEKPESTTWQIWGRNRAALLTYPYAVKITRVWNDRSTRMNIMREIAEDCGLTLDYLVPDFTIPAGRFSVEDEYPLEALKRLAGVDGSHIRSGGGAVICVKEHLYVEEG